MPAIRKYGQSKKIIDSCISSGIIGGLLMLNGTKETFTTWIKEKIIFGKSRLIQRLGPLKRLCKSNAFNA